MDVRGFGDLIASVRNGRTKTELDNALHALNVAVRETGKAGAITFKVVVKPSNGRDAADGVLVVPSVKLALPQEGGSSVFFLTPEDNLTREDPAQPRLELREIGGEHAAVRELAASGVTARNLA